MLEQIITLSLIITAIHTSMREGMLFHPIRCLMGNIFDFLHIQSLRKPLYECLICMGGIYTIVLYPLLYGWSWQLLPVMLGVIGLNTLIAAVICRTFE